MDPSLREVVKDVCSEIKFILDESEQLIEKSEEDLDNNQALKSFSPLMNKLIETASAIDFEEIERVAKKAKAVSCDVFTNHNVQLASVGKGVLLDSLDVMRQIIKDTFNEEKKALSSVIVDRLDWIYLKYNPQAVMAGECVQITPELSKLVNK